MTKFYDTKAPHFQARITIYPLGPETRKTHPFNGIRWAFAYADDFNSDDLPNSVSDVWPEFIDDAGSAIPDEIPIQGTLAANMYTMVSGMIPLHTERIEVGTKFYCMEGKRKCAEGVVTMSAENFPQEPQE